MTYNCLKQIVKQSAKESLIWDITWAATRMNPREIYLYLLVETSKFGIVLIKQRIYLIVIDTNFLLKKSDSLVFRTALNVGVVKRLAKEAKRMIRNAQ